MTRTLLAAVDFKAAFDRTWRLGIVRQLARANALAGWLLWLRAFLTDRRVCVRWGENVSDLRILKEGVPQGSLLSTLLFNIATCTLPEAIRRTTPQCIPTLYAVDLTMKTFNVPRRQRWRTCNWPLGR